MTYSSRLFQIEKRKISFKGEMLTDLVEFTNGKAMTTSLRIAEVFEKDHSKVLRKIKEKQVLFNEANFGLVEYEDTKGEKRPMFLLDRDFTSYIIMGFTGQKADVWKLKYIDAFNKMEEQLKFQNNMALPTTYKEALIQLLEQVEKNEQLEEERKILLPKADYHDEVLNKDGLIAITVIAKDLGFSSGAKLNQVMFLNKIIYKNKSGTWCPYAEYEWLIEEGYTDYKSYETEHAKPCLKWTEKGRKWIIENYNQWVESLKEK